MVDGRANFLYFFDDALILSSDPVTTWGVNFTGRIIGSHPVRGFVGLFVEVAFSHEVSGFVLLICLLATFLVEKVVTEIKVRS